MIVLNRSWESALTPTLLMHTPTAPNPPVGILMDPPYITEDRQSELYGSDADGSSTSTAYAAYLWAVENGARFRVAYCCHEGDFPVPDGWTSTTVTFSGINDAARRVRQDMVMFSPACVGLQQGVLFSFMTTLPLIPDTTSSNLQLRPYQADSLQSLRQGHLQGHRRQILCMPTGGGKTEAAIYLIQEAMAKGSRIAFICDRLALVDQTSERLMQYGIPHGVIQSTNTRGRREQVLVCSAQTLESRNYQWLWRELDLAIMDECHHQRRAILDVAREADVPTIGLSATPLTDGLGKFYEGIVNAVTTDTLLDAGWLAPLRVFPAVPFEMPRVEGEWTAGQVRESGRRIIGNIVGDWSRLTTQHFGGPVKTLVFSADIAHGRELCQAFQLAGHDFRQSTYRDSDQTTRAMVRDFRQGRFMGLVSVEKFVLGFDVPDILCIVGARPYRTSLASVIQQLGRGMRIAPGKGYALYIDHAENLAGWYEEVSEIWANGVSRLPPPGKSKAVRQEPEDRPDIICLGCEFIIPPGSGKACPYCGRERRGRRTRAKLVDGYVGGELTRPGSRQWAEDRVWTWRQICEVALERKHGDRGAAAKHAKWLHLLLYEDWPDWSIQFDALGVEPDQRVSRKLQNLIIAYGKRKGEG